MDENEKKLKKFEELWNMVHESLTREEFEKSFEKVIEIVKKIKEGNEKEFKKIRAGVSDHSEEAKKDVENYIKGVKEQANKYFEELFAAAEQKISDIKKLIKSVKDGKDADEEKILERLLVKIKIPTLEEIHNSIPIIGERLRDALELLQGDERLDISAIKGFETLVKDLEKKIEEAKTQSMGRTGWGAHPLVIQDDGETVDKIARILNFKGTAITSIERLKDGTVEITIDGGGPGGSGLTKETPVGAIDDSNLEFTVANEPFFINVNGAIYEEGDGAYASYAAGTITLAYPVGTGGFIKSYY